MHDLTTLQRDVLLVLSGTTNAVARQIKRELSKFYPDGASNGGIYSALEALVDRDFADVDTSGGPKTYTITKTGLNAISAYAKWWDIQAPSELYKPIQQGK